MSARASAAVRLVRNIVYRGSGAGAVEHYFHAHDPHHHGDHMLVTAAKAEISDTVMMHRLLVNPATTRKTAAHKLRPKKLEQSLSATVPKVYRGQ